MDFFTPMVCTTFEAIASRIAGAVYLALAIAHPASPIGPHVTISIGVGAAVADDRRSFRALVVVADQALYAAKAGGRNRVMVQAREVGVSHCRQRHAAPTAQPCMAVARAFLYVDALPLPRRAA